MNSTRPLVITVGFILGAGRRDGAIPSFSCGSEDPPMAPSLSRPHATAVLLDDDQGILRSATCPTCHTSATLSQSALEAGGAWRCVRCGPHWDAARLAAVAAHAAWSVDHDRVGRRGTEGSHDAPLYGRLPTGRLGGTS
jgi:hypothetical protein